MKRVRDLEQEDMLIDLYELEKRGSAGKYWTCVWFGQKVVNAFLEAL